MDEKTLKTYSDLAKDFSREWLEQPAPTDIYELIERYFSKGGRTIDVGCGNGRDTAWLSANGYPSVGVDAVDNLLLEAAKLYPAISFKNSALPELSEISERFSNVFCETVIMHLPVTEIGRSVQRIKSLAVKNGVLYLSWRVTEGADIRDPKSRLYSAFEPSLVLSYFDNKEILHFEDQISKSSGKRVCRLIAKNLSR